MNPAAKLLLFLLALPILIGVLIVVVPLLLFLLVLSLFIPSVRFFHLSRSGPDNRAYPADDSAEPHDGEVLEAEYTVVDSTETDEPGNPVSVRPPELKK